MSHFGPTTRCMTAFVLNVALLLLPVLSIPTCCCASSTECMISEKCCCSADDTSCQSRCCCDSSRVNDDSASNSSCDGNCQCDVLNVSEAIATPAPKTQQVDWQLTTLLDWSFVSTSDNCSTVRQIQRLLFADSHNVRQSLLAVWLK